MLGGNVQIADHIVLFFHRAFTTFLYFSASYTYGQELVRMMTLATTLLTGHFFSTISNLHEMSIRNGYTLSIVLQDLLHFHSSQHSVARDDLGRTSFDQS